MTPEENAAVDGYFALAEWAKPLFWDAYSAIMEAAGPGGSMTVQKSQIAFRIGPSEGCRPLQFAFVWLPTRRINGRPGRCLGLTFGLGRREGNPRIAVVSEPYPGRFTHHLLLESPQELDETVRDWLKEAADFARSKQQTRRR